MKNTKKVKGQPLDEIKQVRLKVSELEIPAKIIDKPRENISRLDHLYSALSEINEAIIKTAEPAKFLKEICKIVVEDGIFRMAWIGLVDPSDKTMKPVAHWGNEDGYLKQIRISLNSADPLSRGPTGSAARQGEASICNDIEHDPHMKPWRDDALKRGYRSSASFPLGAGEKAIGTLNLYADTINFFNDDEIRLLKMLSSNIYFAIEAKEHELLRKAAERDLRKERDFKTRIIDYAGALIAVLDRNGRIVNFNRACEQTTGYSFSEVRGKPFWDIFLLAEEIDAVREVFNNLSVGRQKDHDNYWLTTDGRRRLISWKNTFLLDESGAVEHIIAIGQDITEHKFAEDNLRVALAESRQRTAETTALLEGSRAILENHNFKDAAQSIFLSCKNLIGAEAGYIALLSNDGSENEIAYLDSGGMPCSVDPNAPMPIRGFREIAYRTGKTIYNNDFAESEWLKFMPQGHVTLNNVLFAPLKIDGKIVGLLGLGNKTGDFTDNDALMASAFGEFAAIALRNSRALEHLRHSEERFRAVAQSAPSAFISIDNRGKIIFWNRGAEEIFGYSTEEILNKPISILMPERFRDAHRKSMEQLLLTGESSIIGKSNELYGLRKDRTELPIELSISRWETAEGSFFTGIIKDITDRKQTEEELTKHRDNLEFLVNERMDTIKKGERKYRNLFENIQVGIFRSRLDGSEYLDVNDKMAEIMGFTRDELIGKRSDIGFFNLKDWEHILNQLTQRGFASEMELQIATKSGEIRTVTASFKLSDEDGVVEGSMLDITESKKAEMAVRQAYAYNRSLIEASIDPFVTIGIDEKITDVNRATEEITGRSRNELIGTDFSSYFTSPGKARSAYKKFFKEGFVINFELEMQHENGRMTPVLYNASFYKDEAGKVLGVFASARDVTKQIETEKAKKEAERKLEEQRTLAIRSDRLRSLGEMAAGIAHELNQPLLGVRGLAQHILIAEERGWELSKQNLNDKVRLIMEQADRMSHIIEHARMFARAANHTEMMPVQVNNVVRSTNVMVESQLKSRGYVLDCRLAEHLPMVLANPYSLEEVILNLISNARDALAEKVSESAELVKIGLHSFKSKDDLGRWVVIQVSDSGKGIPEEIIDKVFDPFFTTKDMDKGTGLGLSISRKIIEEFNGKIEIQSKSGIGTTVSIYLPVLM